MVLRNGVRRTGAVTGGVLWLLVCVPSAAQAHPLGNFSVNHYAGFTVRPDRVEALAVTDTAEVPTLQARPRVDRDGDGAVTADERAAWAAAGCRRTVKRWAVSADGRPLSWRVGSASFRYLPGAAGLRTSRLECRLTAPAQLAGASTTVRVETGADPGRVGWNEITARAAGMRLEDSDVPQQSVSDQLRHYPRALLDSPKGVTHAQFTVTPGSGTGHTAGTTTSGVATGPAAWVAGLGAKVAELAGGRLTLTVGVLAVLASALLGAGHAMLPGHGKSVMAAYLAGRRGRPRDAVTVGVTVTVTHTAGVLVLGLCLTAFSSLAGGALLGWLGVVSGALVALVGAGLLVNAVRASPSSARSAATDDVAGSLADDAQSSRAESEPALSKVSSTAHEHGAVASGHAAHHAHPPVALGSTASGTFNVEGDGNGHHHRHRHGRGGRHHHHHGRDGAMHTGGLIGLGVAGGLVPSPSALVVLLGAVALGRTLFGAALVLAYGLGMAGTLTAVGLLLVRARDRLTATRWKPLIRLVRRVSPYAALLTALLVLVVGVGLMVRSLPATL